MTWRGGTCLKGWTRSILLNNRGEVCEGSISSVFAEIDGRLLTPTLDCGLLPGVLRAEMLEDGRCSEAVLSPADLRRGHAYSSAIRCAD